MMLNVLVVGLLVMTSAWSQADEKATVGCPTPQYVFSWNLSGPCFDAPRGGTTQGAPVTLSTEPSAAWKALQAPGLSDFERDRRAILAMTGGYRASFEFVETMGFSADYTPAQPYQSWGTEYVYVVEDRGDFISLQHIMVMVFQNEEGRLSESMVMKHWRQDWQYEGRELLAYVGKARWQRERLSRSEARGRWVQSVYQVDDSPRYASVGRWQHTGSFSAWESETTWRPLPRRESSVRSDYQVLEGVNRHVILPSGWVQEEENLKLVLGDKAQPAAYLAKELGNNRYQRIVDFDFSEGDRYWRETGAYWQLVRQQWTQMFDAHPGFSLRKVKDGKPLFAALFELADKYKGDAFSEAPAQRAVAQILDDYRRE